MVATLLSFKSQEKHGELTYFYVVIYFESTDPVITDHVHLLFFHFAHFECLRPVWVTLVLATALQHATAKFAFIKKEAGTRDLNNRYVAPH